MVSRTPAPFDVDGAPFENDRLAAVMGREFGCPGGLRHERADFFVVAVVRIFCPGVEAPFDGIESSRASLGTTGGDARRSNDESAAAVASPDPVGRPAVEADVFVQGIRESQYLARAFF